MDLLGHRSYLRFYTHYNLGVASSSAQLPLSKTISLGRLVFVRQVRSGRDHRHIDTNQIVDLTFWLSSLAFSKTMVGIAKL